MQNELILFEMVRESCREESRYLSWELDKEKEISDPEQQKQIIYRYLPRHHLTLNYYPFSLVRICN